MPVKKWNEEIMVWLSWVVKDIFLRHGSCLHETKKKLVDWLITARFYSFAFMHFA